MTQGRTTRTRLRQRILAGAHTEGAVSAAETEEEVGRLAGGRSVFSFPACCRRRRFSSRHRYRFRTPSRPRPPATPDLRTRAGAPDSDH